MFRTITTAAVALVLLVGCGADDVADTTTTSAATATTATTAPATTTTTEPPADPDFPVTITTGEGSLTIDSRPERIVSLSSTATEILFAIGAGGQVVAVDDASNHPPEAPTTDVNGFTVTAEGLAAFDPDLVVFFFDPGDLAAGLDAVGIPALEEPAPATIEDVYEQIEQLGAATGNTAAAAAVVEDIRLELKALEAQVAEAGTPPMTYYYELDETYYSLTSSTFVGTLFSRLGLTSIADPADESGFGYPQLAAEFIIEQDPDLIFLADTRCCGQSLATVAERPGWDSLGAVQRGAVVELDDDVASRWGPRLIDLFRAAAEAVLALESADT